MITLDKRGAISYYKSMKNANINVNDLATLLEQAASVTPEELASRRAEYSRTHPPVACTTKLTEAQLKELGF